MELRQLRYLLTIAEESSFTRAAEKLFVSQSALSQQVKLLEGELGVKLLDRSGRKVLLTPAGGALLRQTRRALHALDEATAEIDELEALKRGELTVAAVETVVAYVIPKAVSQFTQRYPNVRLRVEEQADDSIEQRLMAGEVHVGLGFVPSIHEDIETEPLYEEKLALIITHEHALASREAIEVADLDNLPMVLLPPSSCTRTQWDGYAAQAGIQPRVVVEMNSIHGILQAVRQTNTATILPPVTPNNSSSDHFVSVPIHNPTPKRTVGVLYRRHGYRSRATEAFVDIVRTINPGCME